jgi:hypothetical protein
MLEKINKEIKLLSNKLNSLYGVFKEESEIF